MTLAQTMSADLKEIISLDVDAQITILYQGTTIIGTKGDLTLGTTFDRDGGGTYTATDSPCTFALSDFPQQPQGSEIIQLNGVFKRIDTVKNDDYNVAVVLTLTSPDER